jgi:hypothetical protein
MLFECWEELPVMIEDIKTHRLERMRDSNLCLNLCSKNLCKQTNMPIPHQKDISITQNNILALKIRNKAEFKHDLNVKKPRTTELFVIWIKITISDYNVLSFTFRSSFCIRLNVLSPGSDLQFCRKRKYHSFMKKVWVSRRYICSLIKVLISPLLTHICFHNWVVYY